MKKQLGLVGLFAIAALSGVGFLTTGAAAAECPNKAMRFGPSALLPDCRAYELVTPPDSNGRLPEAIKLFNLGDSRDIFPTELASPSGHNIIYMTFTSPLAEPNGPNGNFDLYAAERTTNGWKTIRRLTPAGSEAVIPHPGGVSSDHGYAFTQVEAIGGGLPSGSLAGESNLDYLSKPDGSFEVTGKGSLGTEPYAQGRYISEGAAHIIFSTGKAVKPKGIQSAWCVSAGPRCKVRPLEPGAPPEGTGAVYDRSADGPTHVVSLLPGSVSPSAGQQAFYLGASKDANSIAFEISGVLYVRVHNGEEGEETLKVAEGGPAYAGISADGRYLFYVMGGESGVIHRFDVESDTDTAVNPGAEGEVVNISADGSHVYFSSKAQIGGEGALGQPNLYVWSTGAAEYVTTVSPSDLERTSGGVTGVPALTRWTSWAVAPNALDARGPGADSSRTTPDGEVLVFESRAQLTAYDNAGHTEVYRYEDGGNSLICVSCNPSGSVATGDARLQELNLVEAPMVIHNVSEDGSRVFFETTEPLVSRDIDGVNDIYEWHEEGVGASVSLISSGQSVEYEPSQENPQAILTLPNLLLSVTPDGNDVVFLSQDHLTGGAGEGGAPAIYDARGGGGFPESSVSPTCLEEECRPLAAVAAPFLEAAKSEGTNGEGNVRPRNHRCHRQGKRKRKHGRCGRRKSKRGSARSSYAGSPAPLQPKVSIGSAPRPGPTTASSHEPADPSARVTGAAAGGDFEEFGIQEVGANEETTAAASHPDIAARFVLKHVTDKFGKPQLYARAEDISVSLPPGVLGNPTAVPRCKTGELLAIANCPIDSQVGISKIVAVNFGTFTEPIYNMEPVHPEYEIARFGFFAYSYPVFIDVTVRSAGDYGVTAVVHSSPALAPLVEAETILWGNPAAPSHDEQRLTALEASCPSGTACMAPEGKRPSGIPPADRKAFMTNPSACQGGEISVAATSYQLPGQVFEKSAPFPTTTDCQGIPFAPTFEAQPTSHEAGAPTGLETKLVLPQNLGPEELGTATMREARVTLPAGMQIAAGAANWIGTCSEEEVGLHEEVDAACRGASKLGTVTIKSPDLSVPIEGSLYQRTPEPGHQFGLWLTADALGLHVKLPGELEPDKETGRLTAVFRDLPQVPVEEIDLNVWGGSRAPLQNPSACGTYVTDFSFAPHSEDPAVNGQSQMTVDQGCTQPFDPQLHAGVVEPTAGKFSPLVVDLTRGDGQQPLRGFTLTLPDGELAKLKGVPLCPDGAAPTGNCPTDSKIGYVTAQSGPGPDPLWIPQPGKPQPSVYLAGPYGDSPFSIVTMVPAQAGPFDLGNVVVRSGVHLDPETNRAMVVADPLPQFFEGVGLTYRRLHAVIDRPEFALNPTDCREMEVDSTVVSTQGATSHPTARFQVDGCKALLFKPKLSLQLKGGSKRGDYPQLTAVLRARKGDTNIARASVGLPHSEFLAQEHIVTVCTRKQFTVSKCPKGSIYGKAKAWTPLLAKPLEGPVYLRSSDHPLPDLVAALSGELDVNLVGRIDSHHGGIRSTFDAVPDAPVTKFVLMMEGGKRGLLTNSTDLCHGRNRASVALKGQNGRSQDLRVPLVSNTCASTRGH